jgi:MSHA pilin protein MshD
MCTTKAGCGLRALQAGATLVELVVFIVVVSVAVAAVLLAMNAVTRGSPDPMMRKQALAIAEALLEEVELMPFTFCDPDDAQASTAPAAIIGAPGVGCATTIEGMGPEAVQGETRYNANFPFDNVNDYFGFPPMNPILDINGNGNPALTAAGYTAAITVTVPAAGLGGIPATDANGQANVLLITVTVTGPASVNVVLQGYRTKYAPNI